MLEQLGADRPVRRPDQDLVGSAAERQVPDPRDADLRHLHPARRRDRDRRPLSGDPRDLYRLRSQNQTWRRYRRDAGRGEQVAGPALRHPRRAGRFRRARAQAVRASWLEELIELVQDEAERLGCLAEMPPRARDRRARDQRRPSARRSSSRRAPRVPASRRRPGGGRLADRRDRGRPRPTAATVHRDQPEGATDHERGRGTGRSHPHRAGGGGLPPPGRASPRSAPTCRTST